MKRKEIVAIRINMPDELRTAFKAQCVLSNSNMNEKVIELIERWLKEEGVDYVSQDKDEEAEDK